MRGAFTQPVRRLVSKSYETVCTPVGLGTLTER